MLLIGLCCVHSRHEQIIYRCVGVPLEDVESQFDRDYSWVDFSVMKSFSNGRLKSVFGIDHFSFMNEKERLYQSKDDLESNLMHTPRSIGYRSDS